MVVYLSNPYGTIPGENWREYRFYLLAKSLSEKGHEVVWFTSTFSHHFKVQRSQASKVIDVNPLLKIHLVKSPSYAKNLSFGRWLRDIVYGINLYKILKKEYKKPDFFINGDSPLTFYFPSFFYCRKNSIPYIIDQMDLWPELVVESISPKIRLLARFAFILHYKYRKLVYQNASGFIALAKRYYEIPSSICPRLRTIPNAIIYNGIDIKEFRQISLDIIYDFEKSLPLKLDNEIWFVFAGTLGPSYDLKTMLKSFNELNGEAVNAKLIIAGDGSERWYLEQFIQVSGNKKIVYVGKLSKAQLVKLYSKCDVGLNVYGAYSNVEMPDKFYDYSAAGLAIINSLKGEVANLIVDHSLGLNYIAANSESLLSAYKRFIHDTTLLVQYKKNSFKIAETFDQNVQLRNFKQFFRNFENNQ